MRSGSAKLSIRLPKGGFSMIINLKTVILCSSAVAVALNVGQSFSSYQQREAAFVPTWAQAASEVPQSTPAPAVKVAAAPVEQTVIVADQPATPAAPTDQAPPPPAPDAAAIAVRLASAGLKPDFAALYLSAQSQTGTPWQLLAAVHHIETGQSGSTNRTSYAGAVGPMQFLPATFSHYARDGNGDGIKSIDDVNDAVFSAANYLRAGGADHGDYTDALYHYNHSSAYVSKVLGIARSLGL